MEEVRVVQSPRHTFLFRHLNDIVVMVLTIVAVYMAWQGYGEARAVVLTAFVYSLGLSDGRHYARY